MVEKTESVINPHALEDEMSAVKREITRLNYPTDAKDKMIIEELQVRVSKLEVALNSIDV